jgi:hypothetical protein
MRCKLMILTALLIGLIGSLSDWFYYPRINLYLYGYQGDGWIFFVLFLILFLVAIFSKFRISPFSASHWLFMGISFFSGFLSLNKIFDFYHEVDNFSTEDPWLITASAGADLSKGLYLVFFSSFVLFAMSIGIFVNKQNRMK